MKTFTLKKSILLALLFLFVTATISAQQIGVFGGGQSISDNSSNSPALVNLTDFDTATSRTFTIDNTATSGSPSGTILNVTSIVLSNTTDFNISIDPTPVGIIRSGVNPTFTIDYIGSGLGTFTSTVTIASSNASNDGDGLWVFTISITVAPDIDILDVTNNNAIDDDDGGAGNSPAGGNSTAFGTTDALSPLSESYTIESNGAADLTISSWTSSNPDFVITVNPATSVTAGSTTTFTVTFTPSGNGSISSIITINSDATSPKDAYTFSVQGTGTLPPPIYTAFYHTFDDSNEGWTSVTSTNDSWTRTNTFTTTDEMGEGYFFRNTAYNTYPADVNIEIESPTYDFTGLKNLKFTIDVKYNTENGNDGMRILYSVDGGSNYTPLGASGDGTNWYQDNVSALGGDGWNDDGHSPDPTFTPHSQFGKSSISLSDGVFSDQTNIKFKVQFGSNGSSTREGVAFDNVLIEADPITAISDASIAPASITSGLRLWLKANVGISNSDNTQLTLWEDQAYINAALDKEDAYTSTALAPTYRDSGDRNINYNPIVDFDHNNVEYMNGKGGLFSQDYFIIFRSDDTLENQTGSFSPGREFAVGGRFADTSFHEDATGIAAGSSTARYPDEVLAHNISSFPNGSQAPNATSYGRAYSTTTDTYSNHPIIVNVKSNVSRTASEIYKNGKRIDNVTGQAGNGADLNFNEFNNLQFLIGAGRSGINGRTTSQMNGMIAEVVSYSSPNSAINKQKIQSYLAIKYGVTLQADASALLDHRLNDTDYIDSQGITLWDPTLSDTNGNFHNYDIAGIGRDDASQLDQRQSRSQNDEADGTDLITGLPTPTSGFLTMALTDTYDTNNQNISGTSGLEDRNFLIWGNNNASLDAPAISIEVNMSEDIGDPSLITNVSFESMSRIWKVTETGPTILGEPADVGTVEVSIPTNVVRTAAPPDGRYLMFISANGEFDPTADYREMQEVGGRLYVDYDFDNTEYITFGWAPERLFKRSIFFNPAGGNYIDVEDNLDLDASNSNATSDFTVSAWINRAASSNNSSIFSKRNVTYTQGYDLKINSGGYAEMSWVNGVTHTLTSDVVIPIGIWHHIAVIYSGTTATMYIDGVEEKQATITSPPLDTNSSFFIGAAGKGAPQAYFHGNIDEVRIWNMALSVDQLHYIMNQELQANESTLGLYFNDNSIVPTKNETVTIDYTNLEGYYPMSRYTYTNTKDESGNLRTGSLKQLKTVDHQTAPLPYVSAAAGDWDTKANWVNGSMQYIPGSVSLANSNVTVGWNVVETSHDLTMDNSGLVDDADNDGNFNRSTLAHKINSGKLTLNGDNSTSDGYGYTVTHYLELNGKIDLEGKSQLIQTNDSDLIVGASGVLEKDRQGNPNKYRYNYWSAPIGSTTNPGENKYTYAIQDILKDRSYDVTFINNSYDGNPSTGSTAVEIADYWIWKFANNTDGDYSQWEHVRRSGNILPGEGFTMKGPGAATANQNYTFLGKPNNADINLTVNEYNDYLVGNPYASAIDANQFIIDNGSTTYFEDDVVTETDATTSGTLYFWEHWGGSSHVLSEYQGGYGTYNLAGAVSSPFSNIGISDPDVSSAGTPTHTPGRYIPVGQAFFVIGTSATSTTINFNNGQRLFKKENSTNGLFARSSDEKNLAYSRDNNDSNDLRKKIKLGFNSVTDLHRQLLLTIDQRTTPGVDWGYDGTTYDYQADDMFWLLEDQQFYVIQASNSVANDITYPLAVYTSEDGENTFTIDELINIPENLDVFVHDIELDYYHNLKESDYQIFLNEGYYDARFEITFKTNETQEEEEEEEEEEEIIDETLIEDFGNKLEVRYSSSISKIVLMNPHSIKVQNIALYNILGQSVQNFNQISESGYSEYTVRNLSPGTYIIKLNTESGSVSKKILIN
jgi:hypothetical protein